MAGKPNEGPVEAFRQVTGAAMRAIARDPELQVAFAPEPASLRGKEARLPAPSREIARRSCSWTVASCASTAARSRSAASPRAMAPRSFALEAVSSAVRSAMRSSSLDWASWSCPVSKTACSFISCRRTEERINASFMSRDCSRNRSSSATSVTWIITPRVDPERWNQGQA